MTYDDTLLSSLRLYLDGIVDFAICCVGLVINAVAIVMLLRTGGARAGNHSVSILKYKNIMSYIDFLSTLFVVCKIHKL